MQSKASRSRKRKSWENRTPGHIGRTNKNMQKREPCELVGRPLLPRLLMDRCWLDGGESGRRPLSLPFAPRGKGGASCRGPEECSVLFFLSAPKAGHPRRGGGAGPAAAAWGVAQYLTPPSAKYEPPTTTTAMTRKPMRAYSNLSPVNSGTVISFWLSTSISPDR